MSSGVYACLVSTVIFDPGCRRRIARSRGVVSRMSPIELKRTAKTFGAGAVVCTAGRYFGQR